MVTIPLCGCGFFLKKWLLFPYVDLGVFKDFLKNCYYSLVLLLFPRNFCTRLQIVLTKPTIVRLIFFLNCNSALKKSREWVLCRGNKQRHCSISPPLKKRNACTWVASPLKKLPHNRCWEARALGFLLQAGRSAHIGVLELQRTLDESGKQVAF